MSNLKKLLLPATISVYSSTHLYVFKELNRMSQFLQYLSASSFKEPLDAVVCPAPAELLVEEFGFATIVTAAADDDGIVGGAGEAACIRM